MNAVEIEAAVSDLCAQPFDREEFPYEFLAAFGNSATTLKRLRSGQSNKSDIPGAVLQQRYIHLAVTPRGKVGEMLDSLRESPKTAPAKAKIILATDGREVQAEDRASGETIACEYKDLAEHFGFFLPLADISAVKEIKDSPLDIRATGRLNKLYLAILKANPKWAKEDRQHDLNQFLTRLIFCFFAEDTHIFPGDGLFTKTVTTMSEKDGSNTHDVIQEIFETMNIRVEKRPKKTPTWANAFPYVNGGLFAGSIDVPKFPPLALTFLQHAGALNWQHINPDIFGSMIQAVADDDERSSLGMHYTSVPNILKVLNPLFLDDVRAQLEAAGDSAQKLLALRKRIANIRVFDPACGSGNFLVIAYKQLREIESTINERRDEKLRASEINITNFRGIEIRDLAAEIARLSLMIAEYQCNVLYRGPQLALQDVLPLKAENWVTRDNALRVDWLHVCPPDEGLETYICGNPPYVGNTWQTQEQKADVRAVVAGRSTSTGFLDYVAGWFVKAADWLCNSSGKVAFVSTNSICQGQSVPILWPILFHAGVDIDFAHTSFKWANLASNNAGVTVAIVGLARASGTVKRLFEIDKSGDMAVRKGVAITPYLTIGSYVIVEKRQRPLSGDLAIMEFGNKPSDGGNLLLSRDETKELNLTPKQRARFIRRILGSDDFINGGERFCLWIEDEHLSEAKAIPTIRSRIEAVRRLRLASPDKGANALAKRAHQLKLMRIGKNHTVVVSGVSSENRLYLPAGVVDRRTTVTNLAFALYDAPLWNLALIASRLHLVWVATVCGKLETRYRYSNTMGWNTFPVPLLTDQNKEDLTRCAEKILMVRERHFPKTIADLYDPDAMPEDLRQAHAENDEALERIFIGRRFKNDTERLEKLFDLYAKMAQAEARNEAQVSLPLEDSTPARRRAKKAGSAERTRPKTKRATKPTRR